MTLASQNAIVGIQNEVTFDEPTHTYTLDGICAPISVTGLLGKCFEEFDAVKVVEKYFDNWKRRGIKYTEIIQSSGSDAEAKESIIDSWEVKKLEACRLGTEMHAVIEKYLNFEEVCYGEIEVEFDAFLRWEDKVVQSGWSAYRTEVCVCGLNESGDIVVGGAIDAIYKNKNGEYVLIDWKRTGSAFGPDIDTSFGKYGTGPAIDIKETSFNKYALQLAIYAKLLFFCTGISVGDRRFLVRLSGDGYQQIDASGSHFDAAADTILLEAGVSTLPDANKPHKKCKF